MPSTDAPGNAPGNTDDKPPPERLITMARACIRAGKLPAAAVDGEVRSHDDRYRTQRLPLHCIICDQVYPPESRSYRLDFIGQPEMHLDRCFQAWQDAAREELIFDREFREFVGGLGCVLWADAPTLGRVRFSIGPSILIDVLGGTNPVIGSQAVGLCERERSRIEQACRHAFDERPTEHIELQTRDFR
jgi:hypothetical protein